MAAPGDFLSQQHQTALNAKQASHALATLSLEARNALLSRVLSALEQKREFVLKENQKDVAALASNNAEPLKKRVELTPQKYDEMTRGIHDIINLPDPLNRVLLHEEICENLEIRKVTCPIGVLAVIYEARPEAGVQITSLAIKSGNALILKGGKEAEHSNTAIFEIIRDALKEDPQVPENVVQLCHSREDINALLKEDELIDLVVPRGSNSLVRYIKENTKIPVLGHAAGICAAYVDKNVDDIDSAVAVVVNSKTNYPAACNAVETLLVHSNIAEEFLPKLVSDPEFSNVRCHADARAIKYLPANENVIAAVELDFTTEFLGLEIAIKIVDSVEEAAVHINTHGSHHTDCILTSDRTAGDLFQTMVDSAGVYVNCSTRFADGFRYGFGAEVGISTNKIHSRGPVGLDGLVIYKYKLNGKGQTVSPSVKYTHKKMSEDA